MNVSVCGSLCIQESFDRPVTVWTGLAPARLGVQPDIAEGSWMALAPAKPYLHVARGGSRARRLQRLQAKGK